MQKNTENKGKMSWDGKGEGHFGGGTDGASGLILKTLDPSPLELPGLKAGAPVNYFLSCGQQERAAHPQPTLYYSPAPFT